MLPNKPRGLPHVRWQRGRPALLATRSARSDATFVIDTGLSTLWSTTGFTRPKRWAPGSICYYSSGANKKRKPADARLDLTGRSGVRRPRRARILGWTEPSPYRAPARGGGCLGSATVRPRALLRPHGLLLAGGFAR